MAQNKTKDEVELTKQKLLSSLSGVIFVPMLLVWLCELLLNTYHDDTAARPRVSKSSCIEYIPKQCACIIVELYKYRCEYVHVGILNITPYLGAIVNIDKHLYEYLFADCKLPLHARNLFFTWYDEYRRNMHLG